jgi:hypothetical protein
LATTRPTFESRATTTVRALSSSGATAQSCQHARHNEICPGNISERRVQTIESGRRESNPRSQLGNPIVRFKADVGERKTAGQWIVRTTTNELE